jgi:hypothetical protein
MAANHEARPERGRRENWLAILDAYGAQFLVLDTQRDQDLYQLARSQSGWTVDFEDGRRVLMARTPLTEGARVTAQVDGARG